MILPSQMASASSMIYWFIVIFILLWIWFLCTNKRKCVKKKNSRWKSWPIVGVLPSVIYNFKRLHDWLSEYLEDNGGTVSCRLPGTTLLITSDPTNLEFILKTNFHRFVKSNHYKERLGDFIGDSIVFMDGDRFNRSVRYVVSAIKSPSFRAQWDMAAQELLYGDLLTRLHLACQSGQTFDLQFLLGSFTFHVITFAGVGVRASEVAGAEEFAEAFDMCAEMAVFRHVLPTWGWKCMRWLCVGPEGTLDKSKRAMRAWMKAALDFKERSMKSYTMEEFSNGVPMDLLSGILLHDPNSLDKECQMVWALTIMLGGKDTIAVALCWFFWILDTHKAVYNEIVKELNTILEKREPQARGDRFTEEEVNEMKYLHACLCESLRLFPSSPLNITEAGENVVLPDGTFVKKGTEVMYSIYAVGRSKLVWGEDACEYKPQRWLQYKENDMSVRQISELKFIAFNAGHRRCLGRNYSMSLMKRLVAEMLVRYTVRVAPNQNVVSKFTYTLAMKHGMLVTLEPCGANTWLGKWDYKPPNSNKD